MSGRSWQSYACLIDRPGHNDPGDAVLEIPDFDAERDPGPAALATPAALAVPAGLAGTATIV
jgi:hypothetical protein